MKKSMFENSINIIINTLALADEREEAFVEELLRTSRDSYEFLGEDKYASPEEARRESKSHLESIALTTPEKGQEWKWSRRLHNAAREWGHWGPEAEVRLRKVGKNAIALDIMKGRNEDYGPWYPADKTVCVTVELGGERPCDEVFAVLYKGEGDGENRRSVPVESKRGPLMAVLSLISR